MHKHDLKSTFQHIPNSPLNYWLLIFKCNGKYDIDMFLPFRLRTAPRLFNLFVEALHWVFEFLYKWKVTHYLDDFLFIFPPGTNMDGPSIQYGQVLATLGLSGALEKNMEGHIVTHLGFEFDSMRMEVHLPPNKKLRALTATQALLEAKTVMTATLDETLGFLSHCSQVIPLGRPFLHNLFSLLRRTNKMARIHITKAAKQDLHWWTRFLSSWPAISMIQCSRVNYDLATDASGLRGIGGIFNGQIFSQRVPIRHRTKHINFKEMFAIL